MKLGFGSFAKRSIDDKRTEKALLSDHMVLTWMWHDSGTALLSSDMGAGDINGNSTMKSQPVRS